MALQPLNPKRNYGIDALRILCMLMIPIHHVITHGGLLKTRDLFSGGYDLLVFSELAVLCAVNCYVLISGYVGVFSRHKYSNLAALWLQVFWYSIGITLLFWIFKPQTVTLRVIFRSLVPAVSRQYWFFSCYFVLFLLIPILNLAVQQLSRRRLEILLLSLYIFIGVFNSVYNAYYGTDTIDINRGYSAWWMMVLYMTGGYIRKYDILSRVKKSRFLLIFFGVVLLSTGLKLAIQYWSFGKYHALKYNTLFYQYTSLNICICAVMLLLFFRSLQFKPTVSRVIAFLAPLTFSVYLIHDHPLVRNYIIKKHLTFMQHMSAPLMMLCVLGTAVGIYLACSGIDLIRYYIFKWLKVKPRLGSLEEKLAAKLRRTK